MWRCILLIIATALLMGDRGAAQNSPSKEERQAKFWAEIKKGLTGEHAATYWEAMDHAGLPGGAFGVEKFEGTLVSGAPADHPNEFLVALGESEIPEVRLKLIGSLEKPLLPGTPITFEGMAIAYTREPFQVTFEVETVNRAKKK